MKEGGGKMKVESFPMFGGGRQTFPTHRVTFTTDFQLERESEKKKKGGRGGDLY